MDDVLAKPILCPPLLLIPFIPPTSSATHGPSTTYQRLWTRHSGSSFSPISLTTTFSCAIPLPKGPLPFLCRFWRTGFSFSDSLPTQKASPIPPLPLPSPPPPIIPPPQKYRQSSFGRSFGRLPSKIPLECAPANSFFLALSDVFPSKNQRMAPLETVGNAFPSSFPPTFCRGSLSRSLPPKPFSRLHTKWSQRFHSPSPLSFILDSGPPPFCDDSHFLFFPQPLLKLLFYPSRIRKIHSRCLFF